MVLTFFANSDVIVNEKEEKDSFLIQIPEVKFYIRNKMAREDEHTITYLRHFETLITDPEERTKLFNAIETVPVIANKAKWCKRYINGDDFVRRIIAFAIVEGIFFGRLEKRVLLQREL